MEKRLAPQSRESVARPSARKIARSTPHSSSPPPKKRRRRSRPQSKKYREKQPLIRPIAIARGTFSPHEERRAIDEGSRVNGALPCCPLPTAMKLRRGEGT